MAAEKEAYQAKLELLEVKKQHLEKELDSLAYEEQGLVCQVQLYSPDGKKMFRLSNLRDSNNTLNQSITRSRNGTNDLRYELGLAKSKNDFHLQQAKQRKELMQKEVSDAIRKLKEVESHERMLRTKYT